MSFGAASRVTPTGRDTWEGEIAPGWDIAGNANGGYLASMAARAGALAAARPDPVSVTSHFLAPGRPGPVSITTRVLKQGRRFTTVGATMSSGETPVLTMLGSFGELVGDAAIERVDAGPPDLPVPDECVPIEPTETIPPPFMGRVEVRLHPDLADFERIPGAPRVAGWFRLRDGEPVDTLGLLVAVDAFPPTVFFANLPIAWVPTLELTTHVRARPAPGWLACSFATRFITGGFLEEDGEVWDATGRLVAQSRQLALLPRA